jgi:hypothetical protein
MMRSPKPSWLARGGCANAYTEKTGRTTVISA